MSRKPSQYNGVDVFETTVTVGDIQFEVEYEFFPATRDRIDEPGEPASVEVYNVCIDKHDLTDLLKIEVLNKIAEQCLQEALDEFD